MIQERTSTLSTDVRHLSHDLHSSVLEYAGLVPVLKAHCDEFARQQKVDVDFSADEGVRSVDGAAALCLYRVTQEALANTARHAHARTRRYDSPGLPREWSSMSWTMAWDSIPSITTAMDSACEASASVCGSRRAASG